MKYSHVMTGTGSIAGKAAALAADISAFLARGTALALALLSLTGASVWEGSAALAPRGELPEDGYYAATNSFPPNTVVDITNLETGKSIRAVVSSGLTTPGLLAILSPDTANRIGLAAKTIGRIRMTQPQDPIAFSRFTEGLTASGDPDYDPLAMLAGEAAREAAEEDPPPAGNFRPAPASPDPRTAEPASPAYEYETPTGVEYPDYAAYSHGSIVDMAGGLAPGPEPAGIGDDWDEDWDARSYAAYSPDDEDSPERTNYRIWEQGGSVGTPEPAEARAREPADPWAQAWEPGESLSPARDEGFRDGSYYTAEARSDARAEGSESSATARVAIRQPAPPPAPAPAPPAPGTVEYILVPTDPRPPARQGPEPLPEGPLADPIGPPARQVPRQEAPEPRLDESLFIDSIEKVREDRAAEAARTAEEQRAAEAARTAEAARRAEEQRAAEAARMAEAARRAEEQQAEERYRAGDDVIVILSPQEEPRGRWLDPIAEAPPSAEPPEPAPQVLVRPPQEAGEPQGPWVEPLRPAPPAPPAQPPPVLVQSPEDAGEPQGPWVEPLRPAPPAAAPPATARPPDTPEDRPPGAFSVPVNLIAELEKGKYYVQIGAYHNAASVESALLSLDPKYPLNVQNGGSADNPVYRLLVGPVNLGESGALVQRFKGRGYRDAYIRSN
jgi:hypothetical protein